MKIKNIYILCFIFLLNNAFSQNIKIYEQETNDIYQQVFFTAKQLDDNGAKEEAAVEYKRYLFLQDFYQGDFQIESYLALKNIYFQNNDFVNSIKYQKMALICIQEQIEKSQQSFNYNKDDLLLMQTKEELELINLLKLNANNQKINLYEDSDIITYQLLQDFPDQVKQAAWISVMENSAIQENWDKSKECFLYLSDHYPDLFSESEKETINTVYSQIEAFKPKKQMLAAHLSFIPGLGQLYSQNYSDSLNSFLLNGSLITLSVYSICTYDLWTFYLFECTPTFHFYKGNLYNAQKDAHEYNISKIDEIRLPLINTLISVNNRIYYLKNYKNDL